MPNEYVVSECSPQEIELVKFFEETRKNSPKFMLESLQRLTTISAGCLGATVAFVQKVSYWPKVGILVFLLLALGASLVGTLPFRDRRKASLQDMRKMMIDMTVVRGHYIRVATAFLMLAAVSAVAGAITFNE
jgi:hypothetical protein